MRTTKNKILEEGTLRQKIKLYFIHIASVNTGKAEILTEEEIMSIYTKIKEPKDIRYYDALRRYTKVFIMVKAKIVLSKTTIMTKCTHAREIDRDIKLLRETKILRVTILQFFDKLKDTAHKEAVIHPEKKEESREVLITLEKDIKEQLVKYENELFSLVFTENLLKKELLELIKDTNEIINEAKSEIEEYRYFINKLLPLKPYKDYINREENTIKEQIELIRIVINSYLEDKGMTAPTAPESQNGEYYLYSWNDIEIELNDNNLNYFKNLANDK